MTSQGTSINTNPRNLSIDRMKTTCSSPLNSSLRSMMLAIGTASLLSSAALAGTTTSGKSPSPMAPAEPETPFVTGTLSLAVDTHFVSYGQDIWAAGNSFSDPLFHPLLELGFDLGGGWTAIIGTWWDVNDNAPTTIGSSIQEIDVWGGFSYAVDDWKFTLLYQSWNYAEQIEHIVDFKIAYSDGVLNPFLLLHGRVADEISFDTGLVTQLGIGPSKSFGKLTLGLPISVAFDTDNFHGGDAGFSFASAGVSATYAMTKNISANIGVTFYHTNDSVIPVNPDSDFFTGTAGITIAF